MVFTVVLRLSLPVTAISASLPPSPCKLLLPWGAVVSQVREPIQPKPISLLPWGCFSTRILWLRQHRGSLLAVSCRAQGKPRLLQNNAGSRQLSHWSTCILLGCLPGSCLHHAWDFTTLSCAITEGLETYRYC